MGTPPHFNRLLPECRASWSRSSNEKSPVGSFSSKNSRKGAQEPRSFQDSVDRFHKPGQTLDGALCRRDASFVGLVAARTEVHYVQKFAPLEGPRVHLAVRSLYLKASIHSVDDVYRSLGTELAAS